MKTLSLLRHADSKRSRGGETDIDRALAERGRRAASAIGAWMRNERRIPSVVLHSTARRAVETWRLVAPKLGAEIPEIADDTLYLAAPGHLFKTAAAVPDGHASVLIVGHNPGLHELALALVGDGAGGEVARLRQSYPAGALAEIRLAIDRWSDLRPASGRLERLVLPSDLEDGG